MPFYDFKKDLPIAQESEKEIAQKFVDFYNCEVLETGKTNAYDLKMKTRRGTVFTVEVKEDFSCYKTGNVGVEFENRGIPSGISVSKSDYYLYKVHAPFEGKIHYHWITTIKLKEMIADERVPREIKSGGDDRAAMNYLFRYYGTFVPRSRELFR